MFSVSVGMATLIMFGMKFAKDIVQEYMKYKDQPIVDEDGKVISGSLEDYVLAKSDNVFFQIFGKSIEEINKEIDEIP